MCGIAGLINIHRTNAKSTMDAMLQQQAHRGPDAIGTWQDENCTLGHNRLSIIDLNSISNQPMLSQDGRYALVFNGEIYNFNSIKNELKEVNWKTQSDTEVLLEAYAKWGSACLHKLNGMFALAIWDTQEQELFIARDRLGVKPLYYCLTSDSLIFASEVRTLLKSGLVDKSINKKGVRDFLKYQWIQAPDTIISAISSLPAGHSARYKGTEWEMSQWWYMAEFSEKKTTDDLRMAKSTVKELFYEAVERRLVSDVPIGAFLSGGIDSSAVVAAMANISTSQINTFSIGFSEKEYDESKYAEVIAKSFNTHHHPLQYSADRMKDEIPHILESFDTPSSDGVNSYVVSNLVKEAGVTVALSGLGGDELFCGYPVFKQLPQIEKLPLFWQLPVWARKALTSPLTLVSDPKWKRIKAMLASPSDRPADLYHFFREINDDSNLNTWLKEDTKDSIIEKHLRSITANETLTWVSQAEISGYTQHVLLKDADVCSMANALEVRVPFFDYELVEYVLSLPDAYKSTLSPKKLLTDSLAEELPSDIINRPKMGFAFPWEVWLKNDLKSFVEQNLQKANNLDIFDIEAINRSWQSFLRGEQSIKWYQIWNLTCLIHWLDFNLD